MGSFTLDNPILCDHRKLMERHSVDPFPERFGQETLVADGNLSINPNRPSEIVSDTMRSPKHRLLDITRAVNDGHDLTHSNTIVRGAMTESTYGEDAVSTFLQNVHTFMAGADEQPPIYQGVNPSFMVKMSEMITSFPQLDIIPIKVPYSAPYDMLDQSHGDKRTVYSSLVANAISGIANNLGIASIAFDYISYAKADPMARAPGVYNLKMIKLSCTSGEISEKKTIGVWNVFCDLCNVNLFPILRTIGGEFNLMVKHDLTSISAINLKFISSSEDDGYYVTRNRMGGMMSPSLGTPELADFNKGQLDSLMGHLGTNSSLTGMKEYMPDTSFELDVDDGSLLM
jgi:hypothetical protein